MTQRTVSRRWRLPLGHKLFVLLLLTAVVPFLIANGFWYFRAQDAARASARQTLDIAVQQSVENTDNFLNTKLLGFLSHSQNAALLSGDKNLIADDLTNFLIQDPDLLSATYVDGTGQEIVKETKDNQSFDHQSGLQNIKDQPEFKVPLFRYGNEYLGPASRVNGKLEMTISTPIVYPENAESLRTFSSSTGQARTPGEIYGVLVGRVSLDRFQRDLSALKIGDNGYLYLLDPSSQIMTNRQASALGHTIPSLAVALAKSTNQELTAVTGRDLSGDSVLQTTRPIERTKWVMVAELPMAGLSATIEQIQQQAMPLFLLPLLLVVILSLVFSRTLTLPIRRLVEATRQIGQGNFDYQFKVTSRDELEQLATAYQTMAQTLKADRQAIVTEKTTLSTVLDSSVEGILGLDGQYGIRFANAAAARMMSLSLKKISNKPLGKMLTFRTQEDAVPLDHVLGTNVIESRRLFIEHAGMPPRAVNVIAAPVPESESSDIRYILTMYDVSKEQELEEMKLDFVSMAAHELRTPLTSLRGYLSFIQDELGKQATDQQRMFLDRSMVSANQLSSLIENLLNASKVERGKLKLDLQPTSIATLVEESITSLQGQAQEKHLSVTLEPSEASLPEVPMDRLKIGEVLTNLISNGIKYTEPGGWVKVSCRADQNQLIVAVADNGAGIPQDALPHLFTMFFRAWSSLTMAAKGSGLGLYISKQIVEAHHGKMWVDTAEGKGSTFSFSLPLVAPDEA